MQLALAADAYVVGTGRAADRSRAQALGAHEFLDLAAERLEDAGKADLVFDGLGGDILDRSAALVRAGGTLITIAQPPTVRPRDGRLDITVGTVLPLAEAPTAFLPSKRTPGKTIIRVIGTGKPIRD